MKEPKIRFKGFRGEWEETPLLDVVTLYNGLTYTPNVIRDHGTLVLRSSNVQEGEISLFDNVYVRSEVATSPNVKKGDIIVVVRNGSRTLIGKHAQIKSDMPNTVIGAFMAGMHTDEPEFLNALLCTRRFDNEVTINLGATINQITNGTFHSMKFLFPDKKEQKALGSYFQHLDALIQSTTKKIESLKQVKAASLQSMFPQEGETTPRVRFKGFEGEWKKVKFGEIAIISRGLTYAPFNLRDKGVRVLRSSNINEDVFVISENDVFVNEECINIEYAEEGNILVTAANGSPRLVGKHAIINNIGTNTTVVGGFMLLISSNESAFLNASMSSSWYSKFLKVGVAGGNGAIGNLSKQELEDTELLIPNKKDERNYIASYFTNLDRQITLHTQRLEKLKQTKSACLDNMFV